jgi:hypothetical protein
MGASDIPPPPPEGVAQVPSALKYVVVPPVDVGTKPLEAPPNIGTLTAIEVVPEPVASPDMVIV